MTDSSHAFAIVDFAEEVGSSPKRLRFADPVAVRRADIVQDVVPLLHEVDRASREGRWCVGFVSYEAASAFDPAFGPPPATVLPLAWFAEFDAQAEVDVADHAPAAADPLAAQSVARTVVDDGAYADAVWRIHEYIRAGDVYQVNFTVPFTTALESDAVTVYERMRDAQGGGYSGYLDTGDASILSASPELFFARRGTRVQCRPMKGTAPRGLHTAADMATRDALLHSEKERAENVMIVDVVRNDLGRIAIVGSVHVSALCEPERYPFVWQLTSTVEAAVAADLSLADVFAALFPPASVTGAPKIRAAAIIRELEGGAREVYCGAVGIVRPGGDATFNVAIRTAWTRPGERALRLNAGGGITVDSTARGELQEVRTKLGAFTRARLTPALFETIRVERGELVRLERHVARMAASADYFDIPFRRRDALDVLERALRAAEHSEVARARLELSAEGKLAASIRPHTDSPSTVPAPVGLAAAAVDARDVRLYHKCVDRRLYETVLAAAPGMFDVLLRNADGAVTELTRGNLVAELEGGRFTPPVECGLLAGTFRAELLERGEIVERVLGIHDVRRADRLWFLNSLRGWVPIALVEGGSPHPEAAHGSDAWGDQSPSDSS